MCDKIKKLLTSPILEDVMIGWELLKVKEIPHNDKRWFEYFDCFSFKYSTSNEEIRRFGGKCIEEICSDFTTNPFWLDWCKHNNKISRYRNEAQNIHNK